GSSEMENLSAGKFHLEPPFTSFDLLVCARKQRRRDFNAERLGGLEIYDELVFGRRLHRQIGGPLALENAVDVTGRPTVLVHFERIRPVGHQAAASNEKTGGIDGGQPVLGR